MLAPAPVGLHGYPICCHVARPVASVVRTPPLSGDPPVIFTCPATSSFANGFVVPIPTFALSQRITVFEFERVTFAPTAVELFILVE